MKMSPRRLWANAPMNKKSRQRQPCVGGSEDSVPAQILAVMVVVVAPHWREQIQGLTVGSASTATPIPRLVLIRVFENPTLLQTHKDADNCGG